MKANRILPAVIVAASLLLCACGSKFTNPGDYLGGGGTVENIPSATVSENAANAEDTVGVVPAGEAVPQTATALTAGATIEAAGDYLVTGALNGRLEFAAAASGAHLYLQNAALTNAKKVIESAGDLTITLLGESTVTNTNADGSTAVDCAGKLTINGTGSLNVTSTKNGVSANSIAIKDATLTVNAAKDGLHAEIDYDAATSAPAFSYDEGGWVVLDGATFTATTTDDGIQADTFVLIRGESEVTITTNGGAPQTITELSSDSGDGKGIKAGAIDWGADGSEITSDDYLIAIEGGTVNINANDDAIHSDGEIVLSGGTLTIAAGDDAVHAEALLTVAGGAAEITRCYEGLEAAKVEISGGQTTVNAADDGVNASDGSANKDRNNPNCHIVISGGFIEVSAEGDGIDSNGTMLISGGAVYVSGPSMDGNAALDSNGGILVDGGYLFAVGPIGMVETPAQNSTQNVISFAKNNDIAAGTELTLADADGNAIFYYTPKKKCRSVIISCPELETDKKYSIYGGNSSLVTFTVSDRITTVGSSGAIGGGFPGGGGMPPGGPGFPGNRR